MSAKLSAELRKEIENTVFDKNDASFGVGDYVIDVDTEAGNLTGMYFGKATQYDGHGKDPDNFELRDEDILVKTYVPEIPGDDITVECMIGYFFDSCERVMEKIESYENISYDIGEEAYIQALMEKPDSEEMEER